MAVTDVHSEYLVFDYEPPARGRKTPTVTVRSKNLGIVLGEIKWFGRWRQFCFYPEPHTVFNVGCMDDIIKVIIELKKEREGARG